VTVGNPLDIKKSRRIIYLLVCLFCFKPISWTFHKYSRLLKQSSWRALKRAESVTGERGQGRESKEKERLEIGGSHRKDTVIDRGDRGWGSQPL
jgi:hypothetical protein